MIFDQFNHELCPGETRAIKEFMPDAKVQDLSVRLDADCLCRYALSGNGRLSYVNRSAQLELSED
jgi:predicted ArsR family transcriptional regulator